jgi:hypothetical protein
MKQTDYPDAMCAPLLTNVESALLDCVSDNLALLLAHAGFGDANAPFARYWRFAIVESASAEEPPQLDLPPADFDATLPRDTGFAVQWHQSTSVPAALPGWIAQLFAGRPVIVLADAYHLPWLPYAGHEHMTHSFVVEGVTDDSVAVVDAYFNATQWGTAEPGAWTVPIDVVATATSGGVRWGWLDRVGQPAPMEPLEQIRTNADGILAAARDGCYRRFISAYRDCTANEFAVLANQTWLLARSRALHHRWLTGVAASLGAVWLADVADEFHRRVVTGWQRAATSVYVGLRRARAGRAVPADQTVVLGDACTAEVDLATATMSRVVTAPTLHHRG